MIHIWKLKTLNRAIITEHFSGASRHAWLLKLYLWPLKQVLLTLPQPHSKDEETEAWASKPTARQPSIQLDLWRVVHGLQDSREFSERTDASALLLVHPSHAQLPCKQRSDFVQHLAMLVWCYGLLVRVLPNYQLLEPVFWAGTAEEARFILLPAVTFR